MLALPKARLEDIRSFRFDSPTATGELDCNGSALDSRRTPFTRFLPR